MRALSIFFLSFLAVSAVYGVPAAPAVADLATAEAEEAQGLVAEIAGQFGVTWPTLIAQIINFLIVAAVLYFLAVKPVISTLDDRQRKISDGLQYAEDMKDQLAKAEHERAETIKKATIEGQRILAEAREQAKELLDKRTNEAAAKAEAMIRKASEATEVERQKMLSDVRQEVAQLVVATSAKVLTRELSEKERGTFADSAARELATSRN